MSEASAGIRVRNCFTQTKKDRWKKGRDNMNEITKTTLELSNAVVVEDIGEALRSRIELIPQAYLEMVRITKEDDGATLSDMVLMDAIWRVRELEKQVKQLSEGK
ncbi:hypothetical protein [Bacillus cereus]|uniref:hypothetical protein n=1 Tax=Bacillus cereus TaxID=1396 RepID=UPI0020D27C98|nr:hypothetical protein [Bacillus cereus]